jgi:type I restriction enzyme S subunit
MDRASFFRQFKLMADVPQAVQRLREMVLQLAVQGCLVPQDSRDEPASTSIDLVSKDVKKAIRDGIIRSHALDATLDDGELPELPLGWRWTRLVEVTRPVPYAIKRGPFGSAIRKDMFVPNGFKVYEQQHAISGDFTKGRYYINEKKFEELIAFEVHPNEILVSCSGTVGRVAIVPTNIERGIINQALLKLSLHQSALLNEYFLILFPAFFMKTDTLTNLSGTAQKNIPGMDILKAMPFPLPPLAEQRRIVTKVSDLMALCDELEAQQQARREARTRLQQSALHHLVEAREPQAFATHWHRVRDNFHLLHETPESVAELRKTILQLAMQGRLVPQDSKDEPASALLDRICKYKTSPSVNGTQRGAENIAETVKSPLWLPEGWTRTTLSNVCVSITDGDHLPPPKAQSGIPFLVISNIRWGGINYSDTRFVPETYYNKLDPIRQPKKGDILYTLVGSYGIPVLVVNEQRFCVQRHIGIIRPAQEIPVGFLVHLLSSELVFKQASAIATGVAQKTVPLSGLRKISIPVPPLAEQKRILTKVDELMRLCDDLETKLQQCNTIGEQLVESTVQHLLAS